MARVLRNRMLQKLLCRASLDSKINRVIEIYLSSSRNNIGGGVSWQASFR